MAHWAEIDDSNIVLRVLKTSNDLPDEGYSWLVETFSGTWVKTSYNGSIRKNFAGVGYFFDESRDAFIGPKPYPSWVLNEQTCQWESPLPYPEIGKDYIWNEEAQSWDEVK